DWLVSSPPPVIGIQPVAVVEASEPVGDALTASVGSSYHVNQVVAGGLIAIYALILAFGIIRLIRAYLRTRAIVRDARPAELSGEVEAIIGRCERAIGVRNVVFLSSSSLQVPATLGIFRTLVILPADLLREPDETLTAAIGHELVHVARRD